LLALGRRVTAEALARTGAQERNALRSRGLFCAGQLSLNMGRYGEAQDYLQESLAIAREIGDANRIAAALQPLGSAALGIGDIAGARQCLDEALSLARKLGAARDTAAAMNARAQLHRLEGELDTAEPLYESVLAIGRELKDAETIAVGLLNLAMVSIARGTVDRAPAMLLNVIDIAEDIGSKPAGQSVLEVSAGLATLGGDWNSAARFYGAAEAHTGSTGIHRDSADEAFLAPLMEKCRGALGESTFRDAESGGRDLSYEDAMRDVRLWLQSSG